MLARVRLCVSLRFRLCVCLRLFAFARICLRPPSCCTPLCVTLIEAYSRFDREVICASIRERPPGLIQHVLTVLVFLFWGLLLPRHPPSSRSLILCPWASILLHGPLDICLDLLSAAPPPPVQKRTYSTCFYSTGGHTPNLRIVHEQH